MKYRSSGIEPKIATGLFLNLFNDIEIGRYNRKREQQQTIKVPVVYGSRSRVLKQLENPNKQIVPPIIAVCKESYEKDSDRMFELYDHLKMIPSGKTNHQRMRGIPINVEFTVSGVALYEDDIDQIVANFIPFFKPDVFVSWKHPKYKDIELKSQVVWNGTINYQTPIEVSETERAYYQFETSFVFKTWFFAGLTEDNDESGTILKVNPSTPGLFELGDEGYGMSGVYVVPKEISFSDFQEKINEGNVDPSCYDEFSCSYPRIIVPDDKEMLCAYPVLTRSVAQTLKIVLVDEDKEAQGYDPTLFGFSASSEMFSSNFWKANTTITKSQNNYLASSVLNDQTVHFEATSSLTANYDLMFRKYSPKSAPANPAYTTTEDWIIESKEEDVLNLFSTNDLNFVCYSGTTVSWSSSKKYPINIKHFELTCGNNPSTAPESFKIFGKRFGSVSDVELYESSTLTWTSGETKKFDVQNDIAFSSVSIVFYKTNPDAEIEVKNFSAYSQDNYSPEGNKLSVEGQFKFELFDSNTKLISITSTKNNTDKLQAIKSVVVDNSVKLNGEVVKLFDPSLSFLKPVFFSPMSYAVFWYKGRKYAVSVGGNFNIENKDKLFAGETFPSRDKIIDGSLFLLKEEGKNQKLYQFDVSSESWVLIGENLVNEALFID